MAAISSSNLVAQSAIVLKSLSFYGFPKREAMPFVHFLTLPAAVAAKLLFQFKSDLEFKCVSHLGLCDNLLVVFFERVCC